MRPLASYVRNLHRAHLYLWWFCRVFVLFRQPFRFLFHYFARTSPHDRRVALRDGLVVTLTGHPHDVITLFVNFVQETYGRPPNAGTVVDIGANLGAYSLFAARCGAPRVLAYEPNSAAFSCLERNIRDNGLADTVSAQRLAVTAQAGLSVRFPTLPGAYNRVSSLDAADELEDVGTTSLRAILERDAPGGIELLKMDCEGAEYEILPAASDVLGQVREIRMEYHLGRPGELTSLLETAGFQITRYAPNNPQDGTIWARRRR